MSAWSPVPTASRTSASSGAPSRHREKITPGRSAIRLATQTVPVGCVTRAAAATARRSMAVPPRGFESDAIVSIAAVRTPGLQPAASFRAWRAAASDSPNAAAASVSARPATSRRFAQTPSCQVASWLLTIQASSARRPRFASDRTISSRQDRRENVGQSSPSNERPPNAASQPHWPMLTTTSASTRARARWIGLPASSAAMYEVCGSTAGSNAVAAPIAGTSSACSGTPQPSGSSGGARSTVMSAGSTPAATSLVATAATTTATCGTSPAIPMATRSPGTTCDSSGGPDLVALNAAVTSCRAASPATPSGPRQSATSASSFTSSSSGSSAP